MAPPTLTRRALNRATLARQLLLERVAVPVVDALERLGGLQAQEPRPPFGALWSRLEGFEAQQLHAALHARTAIRATLMRATLHLVSAADYAALRPALAPALEGAMRSILKQRKAEHLDPAAVVATAQRLAAERPRTFNELRPLLAEAFPDVDERALGYAVRMLVPLVMVPTGDAWAFPPDAAFAPAEAWLGEDALPQADEQALVRRHLAAFGPAAPADVQAWSGRRGLKPVLEELEPELEVFRDERGRTLYDLPGARSRTART
ncbi:MAG TPA: crosslink repair DNA glycosylase YcaQ family protein [Baekduia sp.]|nr:crosslink repair DNA glycosylase YcaQ family protein [Baekduia sp.]